MPGLGTVIIGDKEWSVDIASTPGELSTGLGGVEAIEAYTGMLFDLGTPQVVSVTTEPMLFDIDIIFISEGLKVVGLAENVAPAYLVTEETPCRYFLEVNAGESEGVEVGDDVEITVLVSGPSNGLSQWMPTITSIAALGFVGAMVGGMVRVAFAPEDAAYSRKYLPAGVSPPGRLGLEHHSSSKGLGEPKTAAERREAHERKYGTKELPERGKGLGEKVSVTCPICGKAIEIPGYDHISRSEALLKHLEREHKHHSGNPGQYQVRFVGHCKVVDGLCHTHGYSVSREVRCPNSELTQEEWEAAWDLVHEAFPEGQHNPWVDGWWPATVEEAEGTVGEYAHQMRWAADNYARRMEKAVYNYRRSGEKAIAKYRQYVMKEYERGKALKATV